MAGKFVYLALLLCVSQVAFGDTIENVRKEALKKVDDQLKRNKATNDYIAAELSPATNVLNEIAEQKEKEAIGIKTSTLSEMKKIVESRLKAAKSREVLNFIVNNEKQMENEYNEYYENEFHNVWFKIYDSHFRDEVYKGVDWSRELDEMYGPFTKEATRLTKEFIPACDDPSEIKKAVENFVEMTDRFVEKKMSIFDMYASSRKSYTQKFNELLEDLKFYSEQTVIWTSKAVDQHLWRNL